MPGRHASHRPVSKPRWPRRLAATTVVLVMLGGGGYLARDYLPELQDVLDRFAADESCEDGVPIDVVASPDIAPVLEEILTDEDGPTPSNVGSACVDVLVTPLSSAEAISRLGGDSSPDLWIPDSRMWLERVTAEGVEFGADVSLATSPLVAVASRPVGEAMGWPDVEFAWQTVLEGGVPASLVDPTSTSTGLATLLAARIALGEDADQTQLVGAMTAISQDIVPTVQDAFDRVEAAPEEAPLFTASEQAVVEHNEGSSAPVVAFYPDDGTMIFDYPAVPVTTSSSTAETRAAVRNLLEVLTSAEGIERLQARGFRSPDGDAGELAGVGDGIDPRMPAALPVPPADQARELLQQWSALSLEMRMLAVIDVSGSMLEDDGNEKSRAQLVSEAALTALGLFPETSSVGIWAFSTFEDEEAEPDRHYRELVSIGPLNEELGDSTRSEALAGAAQQIPDIAAANAATPDPLKGWTGLYDTIQAAFSTVKANYEAGKINSIVLLTDGRDEWPEGYSGDVDLETLLTNLEANDASQPIPIIAIGVGPDADMDALGQIAAASGGSEHLAEDPADVQEIFLQAMVERQCRPNC